MGKVEEYKSSSNSTNGSGCLYLKSINKNDYPSLEDYLKNRPKWNPIRVDSNKFEKCNNTTLPFCSSMDVKSCKRYCPQYIALDECSKSVNSGTVHCSISQCAVLVVGAGGLGSPVLMYLASAGIGLIGIMDGDIVEVSNLHRQIIHDECHIGMNKAKSAKIRLERINSMGNYISYDFYMGEKEANDILPLYDIIVDASDNPQTKYLLNDACILYKKSLVIASCIRNQGQLLVLNRIDGVDNKDMPCFRCICPYDDNNLLSFVKNACSSAGVLGTIPGILGTLQATEVLKLASGATECNIGYGRMLIYDSTNPNIPFRCIKLSKNPSCKICNLNSNDIQLKMYKTIEYTINLNIDNISITIDDFWSIYMDEIENGVPIKQKLILRINGDNKLRKDKNGKLYNIYLIDVRPTTHYKTSHLPSSINWPINDLLNSTTNGVNFKNEFETRIQEISKENILLLIICFKGNSSRKAVETINSFSIPNVYCYSIAGGHEYLNNIKKLHMPII